MFLKRTRAKLNTKCQGGRSFGLQSGTQNHVVADKSSKQRQYTDNVGYLVDFEKVLDTVSHKKMLRKMADMIWAPIRFLPYSLCMLLVYFIKQ